MGTKRDQRQVTLNDVLKRKGLATVVDAGAEYVKDRLAETPHPLALSQLLPPSAAQTNNVDGLHLKVPVFPPSSNHCYFNNRYGGRTKTDEARAFEHRFIQLAHQQLPEISAFLRGHQDDSVYSVTYQFYFPHDDLINRTFGDGTKRAAETRYKRVDAENRNKLVSDSLAKALGKDDMLFFEVRTLKMSANLVHGVPQIWIWVERKDHTFFGV